MVRQSETTTPTTPQPPGTTTTATAAATATHATSKRSEATQHQLLLPFLYKKIITLERPNFVLVYLQNIPLILPGLGCTVVDSRTKQCNPVYEI